MLGPLLAVEALIEVLLSGDQQQSLGSEAESLRLLYQYLLRRGPSKLPQFADSKEVFGTPKKKGGGPHSEPLVKMLKDLQIFLCDDM